MEFVDYYRIMGVDESASADEIRRAYRKLARKYHPDVSKVEDAETRFKEVGEAYEVLKDQEKRAEYDALRKYRDQAGNFQPPPGWEQQSGQGAGPHAGGDWAGDHQFSDFFESLFGRRAPGDGAGREFSARGGDLHYVLPVTLEEAYTGGKRSFSLEQFEPVGDGRMAPRTRNITVTIPRGVISGQHLRLKGKGNPGMGQGEPGDLFLEIDLKPHPRYSVEGRDITMGLPVAPWELALGATIDVPTPGGAVKLSVPPNTRPGQKLRMKGRGLPGNPPGDQYVIMQIVMPKVLSESDRQLFEQMQRQMKFDPREQLAA